MRIAGPVGPVVAKPVAMTPPKRDDSRGFDTLMAEAEAEDAALEKDKSTPDDKVAVFAEVPAVSPGVAILPATPASSVMPLVSGTPDTPVLPVPPPPTGGRAGVGGEGLVEPLLVSDFAAVPAVSVPNLVTGVDAVVPGLSPSPQPSPRRGEGVFVVPVVTVVLPSAQPPVGVVETAIREQVAALVAGDDAPDAVPDALADPVSIAVSSVSLGAQAAAPATPAPPALSADAALGLHVAAARHGQAMDGIARDIVAANGSGDGPVRFRMEPATLGAVMVEMARGQDGLTVRIEARDAAARDRIADQQPRLMTDARAAGVQIATVQVEARREDVASSSSYAQQQQQGQSQGGAQGQAHGQAGQPPRPAPVAAWARTPPGTADALSRPGAGSELYA